MSTELSAASASPMPPGVTNPNYKPLPGRLGNLTVMQLHALEKFKKELIEEGIFVEERMDDAFLLRYLRARKFDVALAKAMLIDAEAWRKVFGVDDIVSNHNFDDLEKLRDIYPQYYHKTDIDGRPIYIERLKKGIVNHKMDEATAHRLLQRLVYEYETFVNDRLPACSKAVGYPVETSCTILDLDGVGVLKYWSLYNNVSGYLKSAASIGQNRYPETMGKFYVINAGTVFTAIWGAVKGWLDPVTQSKIQILGGSYKEELLKQIPKENLPKDLGGTCECPGGCALSDAGAWNVHENGTTA
ncbi:hypothetical protein H0H92_001787 [Tricholoma furcatifolium]|nr:hypothetical protein H0H92_001787 [Tricholoma furcatifolium]